jgi:mono/diheme cytochrome c family protein
MLRAAMLFALSTTSKYAIAGMGAAFILFSLISAMVLPRRNPDFPGSRHLKLYLAICALFFVAMMSTVMIYGKEAAEAEPAAEPEEITISGDVTAGKAVFTSAGCGACHTFTPAAAKGTVGPDLDKLPEAAAAANQELPTFIQESIEDPNKVIAPGFQAGIMPPNGGATLTEKQLADLVAFLAQEP